MEKSVCVYYKRIMERKAEFIEELRGQSDVDLSKVYKMQKRRDWSTMTSDCWWRVGPPNTSRSSTSVYS